MKKSKGMSVRSVGPAAPRAFFVTMGLAACVILLAGLSLSCARQKPSGTQSPPPARQPAPDSPWACDERTTIKADVVALEQAYLLNRFAAFVPAGMLYALSHDVVYDDPDTPEVESEALSRELLEKPGFARKIAGHVRLRSDKRPRPLVLRVHERECLDVTFHNLLSPQWTEEGGIPPEYGDRLPQHVEAQAGAPAARQLVSAEKVSKDAPVTRAASFHVNGLEYAPISAAECPKDYVCGGDGSNVGLSGRQGLVFNPKTASPKKAELARLGSLVAPGDHAMIRLRGGKEGTYFAHSTAAPVGGEGDGGQIGLGLFGAVNVEPVGSRWYRSQVTGQELSQVTGSGATHHPYARINYEETRHGSPILNMLDDDRNLVHSDLNAVIVQDELHRSSCGLNKDGLPDRVYGDTNCLSFREFTVIMHDEVHAQQAFAELEDEGNPLHYIKDGMGINYGVASMGSLVMGTQSQRGVGVVKDCAECRAEEFFLSSWANGDPALILKWDASGQNPVGAMYPDDPSNVHHSYLGDPVRFRNIHAGPKETHVFHLHAHQWVMDGSEPNSTYLDSQTISPGATFSYGIEFGGSGNRNYTPGDSIFHCHLYPHFAQGMWELWRVHDSFEDGSKGVFDPVKNPRGRSLPDAEVKEGIETPALVPIPGMALAPMPGPQFGGYPFYIAGEAGHRPPQPPLDMDVLSPGYQASLDLEPAADQIVNGGLPRHHITGFDAQGNRVASRLKGPEDPAVVAAALEKGGDAARLIARKVYAQNPYSVEALARNWDTIQIKPLEHRGEPQERNAMKFHEGRLEDEAGPARRIKVEHPPASEAHPSWYQGFKAYRTAWANSVENQHARDEDKGDDPLFYVNGLQRAAGAPFANPCPAEAPTRNYRAAFIQTELTVNRHGWFDPQGRIVILENDIKDIMDPNTRSRLPEPLFFRANSGECINFKSSNFVPSALAADDFQVFTPTDTIGQHIHLVKFDVTASDGSGNGWNYEDTTFSPDEVRERIFAHWRTTGDKRWKPQPHPLFRPGGDIYEHRTEARYAKLFQKGICPAQDPGESDHAYELRLEHEHPLCGAQRTIQRWWADPILVRQPAGEGIYRDNTLRTVFTHDHMGPSSHQQHGLYAGLVIEPPNAVWTRPGTPPETAAQRLAQLRACADRSDPQCVKTRDEAQDLLLGGADLLIPSPHEIPLTIIKPSRPLQVREDGGPTATQANITAPECLGVPGSNPLAGPTGPCPYGKADQTRREFTVAIADFAGVYNTALEPINPETRDVSARRFGQRQVASQVPRPLAISSEDPGTQLVNYRQEPVALRIAEVKGNPKLGGFDYSQTRCSQEKMDCTGDLANSLATAPHARRDRELATKSYASFAHSKSALEPVSPVTRAILRNQGKSAELKQVVSEVEQWRRDFNCALYSEDERAKSKICVRPGGPGAQIANADPWRVMGDPATPILAAYEGDPVQIRLIQGAQEAQHIFAMNGIKWHRMPGNPASGYVNAQPLGISEHFEFDIPAPGLDASYVDYLYYGSSIDQFWDGMWGLMRVCGAQREGADSSENCPARWIQRVAQLPNVPAPRRNDTAAANLCAIDKMAHPRQFDVSAVRVCDLYENCDSGAPTGLSYNQRFGIEDHNALIFVASNTENPDQALNSEVLSALRKVFKSGQRRPEPLVLRAQAGDCIKLTLRNLLPEDLRDGPNRTTGDAVTEAQAYFNFLPMITDGFNLNQFRMSSSVGLTVPRLAQHPLLASGGNFGHNGRIALGAPKSPLHKGPVTVMGARPVAMEAQSQGNLVPACPAGRPDDDRCRTTYWWSATEFLADSNKPVEFGALPLTSFGDPIKHVTHGLIGALIIEPENAKVCPATTPPRQCRGEQPPDLLQSQLSARVCQPGGDCFLEHVFVMQDAVSATQGGFPVPDLSGAEEPDDYGVKAINYKTEPLWARRGNDPSLDFGSRNEQDYAEVFSSRPEGNGCASGTTKLKGLVCDPETPIFKAEAGDHVRLHIVHPGGHTRQQALTLHGHRWNPYPWSADGRRFEAHPGTQIEQGSYNGFGPMMGISLEVTAGGAEQVAMDYLFHSQASFLWDGGLWGIFRVEPSPSGSRLQ
jgi:hypothetical protein